MKHEFWVDTHRFSRSFAHRSAHDQSTSVESISKQRATSKVKSGSRDQLVDKQNLDCRDPKIVGFVRAPTHSSPCLPWKFDPHNLVSQFEVMWVQVCHVLHDGSCFGLTSHKGALHNTCMKKLIVLWQIWLATEADGP